MSENKIEECIRKPLIFSLHRRTKTQMLLRKTIRKTKFLLRKTLRNFKCLIYGGYQKLPRSLSFNCRSRRNARSYTNDQFYNEFYDILQSDLNRMNINDEIKAMEEAEKKNVSFVKQSPQKNIIIEDEVKERKDKRKNNKRNHSLMNTTPCASVERGLSSS
jgi:hypothetical protein